MFIAIFSLFLCVPTACHQHRTSQSFLFFITRCFLLHIFQSNSCESVSNFHFFAYFVSLQGFYRSVIVRLSCTFFITHFGFCYCIIFLFLFVHLKSHISIFLFKIIFFFILISFFKIILTFSGHCQFSEATVHSSMSCSILPQKPFRAL